MDRRTPRRDYEPLLPEFFPVKLVDAHISVDFVVGCSADCTLCVSRRQPSRAALAGAPALDTRVSPRRVLAWLRSMPSYRAGVPLRIGHDTDAGLAFEKSAELIHLLDPGRTVVYRTARPLGEREKGFFGTTRANLLLELVATPRSEALGVTRDPVGLVRSAAGLPPGRVHWVVGPLGQDGLADAKRVLAALPSGARLTLAPVEPADPPSVPAPPSASDLHALEALAHERGLAVSDFACREGTGRTGRGYFDVDRLTGQADLGRRALDLVTCAGCPSRLQCHGELHVDAVMTRLGRELSVLGLTRTAPPVLTGPRSIAVEVAEPAACGDEAYLSHALGQPVRVALSTSGDGGREVGRCRVEPAVLRRWHGAGFLPVTELNAVAANVLDDLRRRRQPPPLAPALTPPP
ncbi:MAG TPA: hypothetical protein VFP50_20920 [Anaeromyxobacteraceae bacterium]|nr:hypothetical protein [Anaeromyxobacteraceae bacterium]